MISLPREKKKIGLSSVTIPVLERTIPMIPTPGPAAMEKGRMTNDAKGKGEPSKKKKKDVEKRRPSSTLC